MLNILFIIRFVSLLVAINIASNHIFMLGDIGSLLLIVVLVIFYSGVLWNNSKIKSKALLVKRNEMYKSYLVKLYITSIYIRSEKLSIKCSMRAINYFTNINLYISNFVKTKILEVSRRIINLIFNNLLYFLSFNIGYIKKNNTINKSLYS